MSALIKLVFDEPGCELAVELWDRADVIVASQLVSPEARAAVSAGARAGRIDESAHASAVAALEDLYAQVRIVAIDEPLARRAGDLASNTPQAATTPSTSLAPCTSKATTTSS
jgi:hypothetical protein